MQLRCKPGELCVISRTNSATRQFDGLFVTTVRGAAPKDFGLSARRLGLETHGPIWIVAFGSQRPYYPSNDEHFPPTVGVWPDAWLRPIRDDGSEFDETMFWKCGTPGVSHA